MTVWDEVRLALLDLEGSGALTQYPDPRETEDRHQPPIDITLAPWATAAAEELHRRFGDDVSLVVGVLAYPSMSLPDRLGRDPEEVEVTDPDEFRFEWDDRVEVASGYSSLTGLRVHNLTPMDITVHTNGHLTASIIFRPELGYTVPPGNWAVSADLRLENGQVLRTPPMAITVAP